MARTLSFTEANQIQLEVEEERKRQCIQKKRTFVSKNEEDVRVDFVVIKISPKATISSSASALASGSAVIRQGRKR